MEAAGFMREEKMEGMEFGKVGWALVDARPPGLNPEGTEHQGRLLSRAVMRASSQEGKCDSRLSVVVSHKQNHYKVLLLKRGWERGEQETDRETVAVVQAG